MPSVGEMDVARIRQSCEELERLLRPPVLTDQERATLHAFDVDPDERTKDDWWKRYGEVKSFARRKERVRTRDSVLDERDLLAVVDDSPFPVTLSMGREVEVHPASFAKVMLVEDLDYWIQELRVARSMIHLDREGIADPGALLEKIRLEITVTRSRLYALITDAGPEPLDVLGDAEIPEWVRKLTPTDEIALLAAWVEVNILRPERAAATIEKRYPAKRSEKPDQKPTLGGFSFLFASAAWRENRSTRAVMTDRSLAGLMATYALEAARLSHREEKRDAERKKAANSSKRKRRR